MTDQQLAAISAAVDGHHSGAHRTSPDLAGKAQTDRLLTLTEVADYIGVPLQTLYGWRSRGEGPRGIRCGRHIRVRRSDLESWLESQSDPTSAA